MSVMWPHIQATMVRQHINASSLPWIIAEMQRLCNNMTDLINE